MYTRRNFLTWDQANSLAIISPDFNPIESVWGQVKTYIDGHQPEEFASEQRSPNRLHEIVLCMELYLFCPTFSTS